MFFRKLPDCILEMIYRMADFDLIELNQFIKEVLKCPVKKISYSLASKPIHIRNFNRINKYLKIYSKNIQITGLYLFGVSSRGIENLPENAQCCILFGTESGFLVSNCFYWFSVIPYTKIHLEPNLTLISFFGMIWCFLFNYFLFIRTKNTKLCNLLLRYEERINTYVLFCWTIGPLLGLFCVLCIGLYTIVYRIIYEDEISLLQNIPSDIFQNISALTFQNILLTIFQTIGIMCISLILGIGLLIYMCLGSLFAGFTCGIVSGVSGPNLYCRSLELIKILRGKSIGNLNGITTLKINGNIEDCKILSYYTNIQHLNMSKCRHLSDTQDICSKLKPILRSIIFDHCYCLRELNNWEDYWRLDFVLFVNCINLQNIDSLLKCQSNYPKIIKLHKSSNVLDLAKFPKLKKIVTDECVQLICNRT
jgi:hypothetical protein